MESAQARDLLPLERSRHLPRFSERAETSRYIYSCAAERRECVSTPCAGASLYILYTCTALTLLCMYMYTHDFCRRTALPPTLSL